RGPSLARSHSKFAMSVPPQLAADLPQAPSAAPAQAVRGTTGETNRPQQRSPEPRLPYPSARCVISTRFPDPGEPDGGLTASLLPARFESVRLLGHGGMGVVFLARDRLLCRQVAIKILASEFADDAVARERFARETALAGRLGEHRRIVTAHE